MNDLIEPFVAEARELIQSATEDLLALEAAPGDGEAVNRVFRAFHTLKGSVGLFDWPPLLALLHAAEESLSAARAGTRPVDSGFVDLGLETLDAVARCTDAVAEDGRLPPGFADEAARLVARHGGPPAPIVPEPAPAVSDAAAAAAPVPGWAAALVAAAGPAGPGTVRVALRYQPRGDCFFAGDDPLGLVRRLPSLEALDLAPAEPWPAGDLADVFACNLVITVLTAAPREEVDGVFRLVRDQVTILTLPAAPAPARPQAPLDPVVAAILAEQIRGLALSLPAEAEAGHREAAARAAANALRSAGRHGEAAACARTARGGSEALSALLADILAGAGPGGTGTGPGVAGTGPGGAGRGPAPPDPVPAERGASAAPRSLRVEAGRIDGIAALVGELVVARNGLAHLAARAGEAGVEASFVRSLRETDARLARLAAGLHREVGALRLLPLERVFRRFARPVREIARGLGKAVAFETGGGGIGADRTVVENLFEPLLHVIRNAIDHGLETAGERRRAGKPEAGRILVRADRQGGQIVVSVSDDGRGIDPGRIRRRALERGLMPAEALAAMDEAALLDLIFAPGFSTAEQVSDLSGRGVGLDAVRAAAGRLGGRVAVETRTGAGTTIRLVLPQAVALTRLLLVGAGAETYGLPIEAVAEVVRVGRDRIGALGRGEATILRGRTVPVVRLAERLSVEDGPGPAGEATLAVVTCGPDRVAVEIGRVHGHLDAVVRPLTGLVAALPDIAGTTLLGDGRVLLVLDPAALVAGAAEGEGER
ncbi:MAG: chemotaxis protein CheA [Methylobacterium frigidaeris]